MSPEERATQLLAWVQDNLWDGPDDEETIPPELLGGLTPADVQQALMYDYIRDDEGEERPYLDVEWTLKDLAAAIRARGEGGG